MDIPALSPPPRASAAGTSSAGSFAAKSDYMTFLRMLTVQMQNQDPLNPISSTDFAVQLATFSGVEQQTQTNQLLQAMLGRMGLAELGGWIGMEVLSAAGAWFDGAPVTLAPSLPAEAERGLLLVRDAGGTIVDTFEIARGAGDIRWDGRTLQGTMAAAGLYSFTLEAYRGDELVAATPVAAYQTVTEARRAEDRIDLILVGGMRLDSATVTGLRRPTGG